MERTADEERSRADSTTQKAAWLLAFCGVILGIAATQARELLLRADELGAVLRVGGTVTLALACVLVAIAATISLRVLFAGRGQVALHEEEIAGALNQGLLTETKAYNQLRAVRVLQRQIPRMRDINHRRATELLNGFASLLVAVFFFVGHVGVFLADAHNGLECGRTDRVSLAQVQQGGVRIPPCPKTTTVVDTTHLPSR
ncbi:MAG TPA: hypothetical protein VHF88_06035 [Thermoleophilaceae bacterium]|nr:hypothetical protein [Thermoleophilaceae bacterium]